MPVDSRPAGGQRGGGGRRWKKFEGDDQRGSIDVRGGRSQGEGGGGGREGRRHREKERINALKQQAATTLIGHFVHLFDLFKLWDN